MPSKNSGVNCLGPFLVALAALLWATDALFRVPTLNSLSPTLIVFFEHAIGLCFLIPWIFFKQKKKLLKLTVFEWVALAFIGIGGSTFGTIFFTASFRYINPSVTILLQKLQPLIVVLLAVVFLKERPSKKFYALSPIAIAAGVTLSFPDLDFSFLSLPLNLQSKGVIYALSAAALWAIATVVGKALLRKTHPQVATFWRYTMGLAALAVLLVLPGETQSWSVALEPAHLKSLAYMALFPGVIAMLSYYNGLERTSASVATLVELIFPVSAVLINAICLGAKLSLVQVASGLVLLASVTVISFQGSKD